MSLLEYLRKSNDVGDVVLWIRKAHLAADAALDLAEFAQAYTSAWARRSSRPRR